MARRSKNDPNAPELDRAIIITSSIHLIDRDGLDAFSLRALARHLGAGNMSLYYYVNDRDELLALVLDDVLATVNLTRLPSAPIDALGVLAKRFVAAFTTHPNTIALFTLRPLHTIGPNGTRLFDKFVELLRAAGLSDQKVADTTVALIEYLCGHLTGHLPQVRHPHDTNAQVVDDVLDHLPDGLAPNIQALAPALRRAVDNLNHIPGVALILAGAAADTSSLRNLDPHGARCPRDTREIGT